MGQWQGTEGRDKVRAGIVLSFQMMSWQQLMLSVSPDLPCKTGVVSACALVRGFDEHRVHLHTDGKGTVTLLSQVYTATICPGGLLSLSSL